jgi:hypothetical protein
MTGQPKPKPRIEDLRFPGGFTQFATFSSANTPEVPVARLAQLSGISGGFGRSGDREQRRVIIRLCGRG